MKITGINIGEYRQFKNIKFDFTYPEDYHDESKRGKPLEKVCFIGQSGTGKTTLLNTIWDFFQVVSTSFQRLGNKQIDLNDEPYKTFRNVTIRCSYIENEITLDNSVFEKVADWKDLDEKSLYATAGFHWLNDLKIYNNLKELTRTEKLALYIDEAAVSTSKNLLEERDSTDRNIVSIKGQASSFSDTKIEEPILGLSEYPSEVLWSTILGDIDLYDNELKQFAANLVSKNSFSESRLITQISQWQKEHPNPRADLAENCLNQILNLLYLEVDTDGTESRLVLKTNYNEQISGRYLSTGVKQLLATSIPIYKIKINNGVILFDEPERSLFPDIQRELIKHYTSLAPKAQFFFATHSPIIASAFEPCERFILYFNEIGEVKCRNGVAPIGDDPNDVLRQDFGLNELMLDEGLEAHQEYRRLGSMIRQETDDKRKNELIAKRIELGNRYNF
ncbi:AAA family ATPase [Spirosoma sp. BT702]|uniref:AAA family ATPase n=1 Tax=Spirosoma profusum TaxID=2771354 RepID=A0A926Y2Q1_9BACT|nr:AAA family ATPase [Spirosoma profusum]MBD2701031.1 AAA family ATPase [Spirosoma profusum]